MVSTSHSDARMYFDRDVACVKRFFERRFGFTSSDPGPTFDYAMKQARAQGDQRQRLDVDVEASGFSRKMAKDLDNYMKEVRVTGVDAHSETEEGLWEERMEGEQSDEDADGSESDDELESSEHNASEGVGSGIPDQGMAELRIKA